MSIVVFHVATLMPTLTSDPQCSNKKLHIGNDFVTLVYNESGQPYQFGTIKVCPASDATHCHIPLYTQGQFCYVEVVVEPLPAAINRVGVAVRAGMEGMLSVEPQLCSSLQLPVLARIKALQANVRPQLSSAAVVTGTYPYSLLLWSTSQSPQALQTTILPTGFAAYDRFVASENAACWTVPPPHSISPHIYIANTVANIVKKSDNVPILELSPLYLSARYCSQDQHWFILQGVWGRAVKESVVPAHCLNLLPPLNLQQQGQPQRTIATMKVPHQHIWTCMYMHAPRW